MLPSGLTRPRACKALSNTGCFSAPLHTQSQVFFVVYMAKSRHINDFIMGEEGIYPYLAVKISLSYDRNRARDISLAVRDIPLFWPLKSTGAGIHPLGQHGAKKAMSDPAPKYITLL